MKTRRITVLVGENASFGRESGLELFPALSQLTTTSTHHTHYDFIPLAAERNRNKWAMRRWRRKNVEEEEL